MNANKKPPWLNENDEKEFFRCKSLDIENAINLRQEFDCEYGIRFNGVAIRKHSWVVGFEQETAENDDLILVKFIEQMLSLGEEYFLAIPGGTPGFEFSESHDVVDFFEPPLIAKFKIDLGKFQRIRGGWVHMLTGSFFVFGEQRSAVMLVNNGRYKMFAGPRDIVEKTLGCSVEESWEPVRKDGHIDALLLYRLRASMIAYGIQ